MEEKKDFDLSYGKTYKFMLELQNGIKPLRLKIRLQDLDMDIIFMENDNSYKPS